MKVFLSSGGDVFLVRARAEGGGALGDLVVEVRPGDSFLGHTYDDLAALGEGAHDLEPLPGWEGGMSL